MTDFATKIYNARIKANMTQEEAAALLGITSTTLRNWEHGRTEPPVTQVVTQGMALAALRLGIATADL